MIRYFVLFAGFALLAATPAAAHSGAVEVIRGAEIQAGAVAKSVAQAPDAAGVPAGVQVLRGVKQGARSPDRAEAVRHHRRARAHHRERLRVEAGEDLWLVDRAGERLTACRLFKTAMVGGWEIRCYDADLPAGTY